MYLIYLSLILLLINLTFHIFIVFLILNLINLNHYLQLSYFIYYLLNFMIFIYKNNYFLYLVKRLLKSFFNFFSFYRILFSNLLLLIINICYKFELFKFLYIFYNKLKNIYFKCNILGPTPPLL